MLFAKLEIGVMKDHETRRCDQRPVKDYQKSGVRFSEHQTKIEEFGKGKNDKLKEIEREQLRKKKELEIQHDRRDYLFSMLRNVKDIKSEINGLQHKLKDFAVDQNYEEIKENIVRKEVDLNRLGAR